MGRHRKRNTKPLAGKRLGRGKLADEHFKRVLSGLASDERGQSTVEYAIVLAAMLAIVAAIGMLWNAIDSGLFVQHAVASASHHLQGSVGGVVDVFCF